MARLSLTLLGSFRARLDSGRAVALRGKKTRALVAFLALSPGRAHSRDELMALLWGDRGDEQARHSLRQTLHEIRVACAGVKPAVLAADTDTVALNAEAVDVDVAAFERLAGKADADALARAAALYAGDLLTGLVVHEDAFEDWLRGERERLRRLAVRTLTALVTRQAGKGAIEPAVAAAHRLVALDPLREASHRSLMQLYVRQGHRAAALRQYQVCVDTLQGELGVEPEATTRQLYQQIVSAGARAEARVAGPDGGRRAPSPAPVFSFATPLVARGAEMAALRQHVDDAARRHGAGVVVLGEAGVGKTRLVEEVAALGVARGHRVLTARGYESTQVIPFGPWIDALRADAAGVRAALGRLNAAWRAELARLLPELEATPAATGDAMRLFEALAQLVATMAAERPLLVIVEDLHWADEMSVRLLAYVARRLGASPVLVVVTAREEELEGAPWLTASLAEFRQHARLTELRLRPLSRDDTRTLVRARLAGRPSRVPVERLDHDVWTLSEGNPFVALETLHALEESPPAPGDAAPQMPQRVRDLVTARIARLTEGSRHLVAVASVIGREFDFTLLQAAAGVADRQAAEAVEELVRRRVFRAVGERLDFAHERIRQVALGELVPAQRRILHRLVAGAIEQVYASSLEPHHSALATHYAEGEVWERAVVSLRHAGAQALARSAYRQAAACLEHALAALARLPETPETLADAIDVRLELRHSLSPLAEFDTVATHLKAAEMLATRLGDQRRLGWVSAYLSWHAWATGQTTEAREFGVRAEAIAEQLGDVPLLVLATLDLGGASVMSGDWREAHDRFVRVTTFPDGELASGHFADRSPGVVSRAWLAWTCAELGDFEEGIAWGAEGVRIAERLDTPYSLIRACSHLGYLHAMKGDVDLSAGLLERAVLLCREHDVTLLLPYVMGVLAYVRMLSGRSGDGARLLQEAVAIAQTTGVESHSALLLARVGDAFLLAGQPDPARLVTERALALARERTQRGGEAWALAVLGAIAARAEPPDPAGADASYRQALALASELGMRPLVAHCHLGLGEVHRRAGKAVDARERLGAAAAMFREMGMGAWAARAAAGA